MLRNRGTSSSRGAMNTKQAVIGDHHHQSSTENCYKKPPTVLQSFFVSPRFKALFTNSLAAETHHELSPTSLISPTSILDSTKQHFSPFCNPIWDHDILSNPPTPTPKSPNLFSENKQHHHQEVVGLALIDKESSSSNKQTINNNYNHQVLFGTKLRVIKTLPIPTNEMELSEEYTCVISHGPNQKTTRIFDNCILEESYCSLPDSDSDSDAKYYSSSAPDNFLSFCYTCKKNLEQKHDIYIYSGEKAFCSQECRYQEMLQDDGVEN